MVRAGALVAGFAVLTQTAAHLANRAWLDTRELNADVDDSVLTWLAAGSSAAAALAAFTLAVLLRERRVQLVLLVAVLGLFALDDVIALHERASIKAAGVLRIDGDYARVLWPVLYFPLLVFALVVLWQLAGRAFHTAGLAIRLGLGFLAAAVGTEALWATWHVGGGEIGDWPDTVEVAIEEGLELAGWMLIASGLVAIAVQTWANSRSRLTTAAMHASSSCHENGLSHGARKTVHDGASDVQHTGARAVDGGQRANREPADSSRA